MKITCQSCQAKYTIADDKVLGKVVKIRCKKCGTTIVVNGSDTSAGATTSAAGTAEDQVSQDWTVNVADGDQRTMTDDDVLAAYASHVIDAETYCWRDGMADWLPLREIAPLWAACNAAAPAAAGNGSLVATATARAGDADRSKASGSGASDATSGRTGGGAARRTGGRAPIADLFEGAAQAGGDDDVMTSVPAKLPEPHDDPQKLTGARNESSVLFSLSNLGGDRPVKTVLEGDSEKSGLIDIRQLSAQISTRDETRKSSRVDDIMNLSGGGFVPALTAPVLSAPTIDVFGESPGGSSSLVPGSARSRRLLLLSIGLGAVVIAAAVGGAMKAMSKSPTAEASPSASSAAIAASAASSAPAAETSAAPLAASEGETKASAALSPSAEAKEVKEAKESTEPQENKPAKAAAHEAAPAAPKPAAESDQPFNMGEAKARLGAAADGVQSCKKGSTTGTGHVVVTFAPSGGVQAAVVDGPPFEGTPTGACVAGHFRSVRVPAFGGSPFKVRKSFTIN